MYLAPKPMELVLVYWFFTKARPEYLIFMKWLQQLWCKRVLDNRFTEIASTQLFLLLRDFARPFHPICLKIRITQRKPSPTLYRMMVRLITQSLYCICKKYNVSVWALNNTESGLTSPVFVISSNIVRIVNWRWPDISFGIFLTRRHPATGGCVKQNCVAFFPSRVKQQKSLNFGSLRLSANRHD